MTHRSLSLLALVPVSALLASCSGAGTLACGVSHPYATYQARPALVAPAGVTLPAPDPAYVVPAAGTRATAAPAAGTALAQPCLVTPPSVLTPADLAPARKPAPMAGTGTKPVPATPGAQPQSTPAPATGSPVAGGGRME